MADNWQMFPPWSASEGPANISPGSLIRNDFDITNQTTSFENMTNLEWIGLSRQEVANLRNLIDSQELKQLLSLYNYGLSWGANVDMGSAEDPSDAEFGFSIHFRTDISEISVQEIVRFIKSYRVH